MKYASLIFALLFVTACFREVDFDPNAGPEQDSGGDILGDDIDDDDANLDDADNPDDVTTDPADDPLVDAPNDTTEDILDDGVSDPDTNTDADVASDTGDASDADTTDVELDTSPDVPVCMPSQEICDGQDNDCDEEVDEASATMNDPNHCGACDVACEIPNAVPACRGGVCALLRCVDGWVDCDGDIANGCETESDGTSCAACADLGVEPGEPCGTCALGTWQCEEDGNITCQGDLGEDALNVCGGCDPIDDPPTIGTACGTCDTGVWACDEVSSPYCENDQEDEALNACDECRAEDNCDPGDIQVGDACGACGVLTAECGEDCRYPTPACIEPGICEANEVETEERACGPCDRGIQTRTRACREDLCDWDAWSEWSACETDACVPNTEDPGEFCGACRTRFCNDECEWDDCSVQDDAVCAPGQTSTCDLVFCRGCNPRTCDWFSCRSGC